MPGHVAELDRDKIYEVETDIGKAYVAGVEDVIVDRILATKHWDSTEDEAQAVEIGVENYSNIEWSYIKEKCEKDLALDKYLTIKRRIEGRISNEKGKAE